MQKTDTVLMAHGSGGTMMRDIIEQLFFEAYAGDTLRRGDDAATLDIAGGRVAFSTDTFVVTPHFFPGGDIGHLAVCGTVNDVATSGATPRYLSCGFVLEEGYPLDDLRRVCASMAATAKEAGVEIVTGDTKVVNRGHGDGIYINTAGIGELREGIDLSASHIRPGDKVLISGSIGDHGIAIISTREELSFSTQIESDAAPLNHLIAAVLDACPAGSVRAFRDPTRGGLASTLNEFASTAHVDICVDEDEVPCMTRCVAPARCLVTTSSRLPTRARWSACAHPRWPTPRLRPCVRTSMALRLRLSARYSRATDAYICARPLAASASSICSLASSSPASARTLYLTCSSHLHAIIRCQEQ